MIDLPEVGSWARLKLRCLSSYLHAYTTIMKDQSSWCKGFIYIDAFAGPGAFRVRQEPAHQTSNTQLLFESTPSLEPEESEFIDGSPRVALGIQHPFTRYIFIELKTERLALLRQLSADYPNRSIKVVDQNCNDYFSELLDKDINWKKWRALFFLDPFGMQVHWDTLSRFADTGAVEAFINFPAWMAIQRMMPRDPDNFPEGWKPKLDSYFGTSEWFDVMYSTRPDLFGDESTEKTGTTRELVSWYKNRLEGIFGHVSAAAIVKSNQRRPLYCLIHAGPNAVGSKIANNVLMGLGDWI